MSETKKYELKIEKLLQEMPLYVYDYYYSKKVVPYSFVTLYDYFLEYRRFFHWMIENKVTQALEIKSISLHDLEHLKKREIEKFSIDLRDQIITKHKGSSQRYSVNRSMAALKSLFKYLSEESEDDRGETYIDRNVMRYITLSREHNTLSYRASRLDGKLFLGTETTDFLEFIDKHYQNKISNTQRLFFEKNKKRDLAIVSLFLASGIRMSELIHLDICDLNLESQIIHVLRKGNKDDVVPFAKFALPYLTAYLDEIKNVAKNSPLFTTKPGKRISSATINVIVGKYSSSFKVRVTPHMLRHTLATRLYDTTHSQVTVSHQLGHTTTQATVLYTHIVDEQLRIALDDL